MSSYGVTLRPTLMIGLGGAGGRTLRYAHERLTQMAIEVGHRDLPPTLQFLHIDLPEQEDPADAELPSPLRPSDYVGLARAGRSYAEYDEALIRRSPDLAASVAGWRPDPRRYLIDPTRGSGQVRSIGRMIYAAGSDGVTRRVTQAGREMTAARALEEHNRFWDACGLPTAPGSGLEPLVFIVSSLSGGSGSALVIDVCDLLRAVAADHTDFRWMGAPIALLFGPDVFDEISRHGRSGIEANSLAALTEITAAYWNPHPFDSADVSMLEAAGLIVKPNQRTAQKSHGPAYSFIVGRGNSSITLADQNAVYDLAGAVLASLASDQASQDRFAAYVLGNWISSQRYGGEAPFLPIGRPKPLSAIGQAHVGLGRTDFAKYATRRLALASVDQLLDVQPAIQGAQPPDQVARDRASKLVPDFLGRCRLPIGPDLQPEGLLDDLLSQSTIADRVSLAQADIGAAVRTLPRMSPIDWSRAIAEATQSVRKGFRAAEGEDLMRRAMLWTDSVQARILAEVAEYCGMHGLTVTINVLRSLSAEDQILGSCAESFRTQADRYRARVDAFRENPSPRLQVVRERRIASDHPVVADAIASAAQTLGLEAAAEAADLAAELLNGLEGGFMVPLERALETSARQLLDETSDRPALESVYSAWVRYTRGGRYRRPANSFVLESFETFGESFETQLMATVGSHSYPEAERTVIREVVRGSESTAGHRAAAPDNQSAVSVLTRWLPARLAGALEAPRSADFKVSFSLMDLSDRARRWVGDRSRPIGAFVHESLAEHLDSPSVAPAEMERRRTQFATSLRSALGAAQPLVTLDEKLVHELYPGLGPTATTVLSPLPFGVSHPARAITEDVLSEFGFRRGLIESLFDERPRAGIDIQTFLEPMDPVVFASLMLPIRSEWLRTIREQRERASIAGFWSGRRTQPLDRFVPIPPELLRSVVRGWFVSRLLEWSSQYDALSPSAHWVLGSNGARLNFPTPLLGEAPGAPFEVLPALLESVPLAILDFAAHSRESSNAYARLEELGAGEAVTGGSSVGPELATWISAGSVRPGLPIPAMERAGPGYSKGDEPENQQARIDACSNTLELFLKGFTSVVNSVEFDADGVAIRGVTRSWELRDVVQAALVDLIQDIGAFRSRFGVTA